MAGSYNKIIIIGNLGRDPEARVAPSGDNVASFSLATSERRQNQPEVTTWFNISAWGQLADIATQYLHKGSYVYVEGGANAAGVHHARGADAPVTGRARPRIPHARQTRRPGRPGRPGQWGRPAATEPRRPQRLDAAATERAGE